MDFLPSNSSEEELAVSMLEGAEVLEIPNITNNEWYRLLAFVQAAMIICGLSCNLLKLTTLLVDSSLRSFTANVFIINLGCADLTVNAVVMPFALLGTLFGERVLGAHQQICEVVTTICTTACVASIATIVVITVNRYVALLHPIRYASLFTHRTCCLMCIIPWLVGFGWALPLHLGWSRNTFDPRFTMCWYDRARTFYSYRLVRVLGMEIVPIIIISFLYVQMFRFIRSRRKVRVVKSNLNHPVSTITDDGKISTVGAKGSGETQISSIGLEAQKALSRDINMMKTLFILFIAFLCCWSLLAIVLIFDIDNAWPRSVHVIAITMVHLGSSGLNFLLYSINSKSFRTACRSVLIRVCYCAVACWKRETGDVSGSLNGESTKMDVVKRDVVATKHAVPSHQFGGKSNV